MRRRSRYGPFVFALALALSLGCNREEGRYSPQSVSRVLGVSSADLRAAIAARVGSEDRPAWVTPSRWQRVRAIYQRFGNSPLWLEGRGLQDRATALLEAIHAVPDHALDTAAYPVSAIEGVVNTKRLSDDASAGTLADADILLTSAYVAYAADMLAGQVDPKTVSQAWFVPALPEELDSAIVRGIEGEDMKASLAAMAPRDPDYDALKEAYARYRRIAVSGGWPTVTADNGATTSAALQARLAAEFKTDSSRPATPGADSVSTDAARATAA